MSVPKCIILADFWKEMNQQPYCQALKILNSCLQLSIYDTLIVPGVQLQPIAGAF